MPWWGWLIYGVYWGGWLYAFREVTRWNYHKSSLNNGEMLFSMFIGFFAAFVWPIILPLVYTWKHPQIGATIKELCSKYVFPDYPKLEE